MGMGSYVPYGLTCSWWQGIYYGINQVWVPYRAKCVFCKVWALYQSHVAHVDMISGFEILLVQQEHTHCDQNRCNKDFLSDWCVCLSTGCRCNGILLQAYTPNVDVHAWDKPCTDFGWLLPPFSERPLMDDPYLFTTYVGDIVHRSAACGGHAIGAWWEDTFLRLECYVC